MTLREQLKQMEAASTNDALHKATLHAFLGVLVDEIEGAEADIQELQKEETDGKETVSNPDAEQAGADVGKPKGDDPTPDATGKVEGAGGKAGADAHAGAGVDPAPVA